VGSGKAEKKHGATGNVTSLIKNFYFNAMRYALCALPEALIVGYQ
jgi:hypothetical protein